MATPCLFLRFFKGVVIFVKILFFFSQLYEFEHINFQHMSRLIIFELK